MKWQLKKMLKKIVFQKGLKKTSLKYSLRTLSSGYENKKFLQKEAANKEGVLKKQYPKKDEPKKM